ncbi:MAG: T9SS type A sorting domain-containing protein [Armatimonadetes bacterium]|nr:T9SS type A sorting domain-containing protein [Armatimonadota bacterium]
MRSIYLTFVGLLLFCWTLWASAKVQEQTIGSLSGSSFSGKLQVEAFVGVPWVVVSKYGSLNEKISYPAILGDQVAITRIPCFVQLDKEFVTPGEQFTVECYLNISGTGFLLGGYTSILTWDTTQVAYQGYSTAQEGRFVNPKVNDHLISDGKLIFSEAVAEGDSGLINLLNVSFRSLEVSDSVVTSFNLKVLSINTARTFQNILGLLDITPGTVIIKTLDTTPPKIENVTRFVYTSNTQGPYVIEAKVEDPNLTNVKLFYRTQGDNTFSTIDMVLKEQLFSGSIPGQPGGTTIEYYIMAADSLGNIAFDPTDYKTNPYSFDVIIRPPKKCDFSQDGRIGIADVIVFLLFARDHPNDPRLDWNEDDRYTIEDAVAFLFDIRNGTCPDLSVQMASVNEIISTQKMEGLSESDVKYIEEMLTLMELTPEQRSEFDLVLYGESRKGVLPKDFSLAQNSPNPFNPFTTISYTIPVGAAVQVRLCVYNIRGKLVKTLVNNVREPGSYSVYWDGTDESARMLASGVYIYRIMAGEFAQTRKMVLLK